MKNHSQRKIRWRNVGLTVVALLLLVSALYFFHFRHSAGTGNLASGPGMMGGPGMGGRDLGGVTPVHSGTAKQADVTVYLSALGTVVANASVTVTSRVDGQLLEVFFTEGQKVAKGQLLAQIDPRSYQATLEQYQGELAQDRKSTRL